MLNLWRGRISRWLSNTLVTSHPIDCHSYFAFYCCFLQKCTFGTLFDFPRVLIVFPLFQLLWGFGISSNLSIFLANPFKAHYLQPWVNCPEPSKFLFCSGYSWAPMPTFILLVFSALNFLQTDGCKLSFGLWFCL